MIQTRYKPYYLFLGGLYKRVKCATNVLTVFHMQARWLTHSKF